MALLIDYLIDVFVPIVRYSLLRLVRQQFEKRRSNTITTPLETIRSFFGDEAKRSNWLVVDQATIQKFGEATGDLDWLHLDTERAEKESPFGTTIAHGFWTLSMLTYFSRQMTGQDYPDGATYALNYGFDRVRMMSPVPVGSRIRCVGQLLDVTDRGDARYLVKSQYRIEVEGQEKPALIADWLCLFAFAPKD